MSDNCEHKYSYMGTVYWFAYYSNPGTSARDRHLADKFFCEKCLNTILKDERVIGNSYDKPIPGTIPK